MSRDYCIVLCHPDESKNIGSVCRAMANTNILSLRIVGNKADYDEEQVRILSIHAFNIWEQAQFYNTLQEATNDCIIAAGTTRRKGKKRKEKLLLPEEFAAHTNAIPSGTIAIVFGNERTGLTDDEMNHCTLAVTIPTSQTFPSINLSHAVQIITYTLFRTENSRSPGYIPIDLKRLKTTTTTITDSLKKIGFFSLAGREDMERFWTETLSRAALSEGEAVYVEKLFTKIAGLYKKSNTSLTE